MTRLKLEPLTIEDAAIFVRLMNKFSGTPYFMRISVAGAKDADVMYHMQTDIAWHYLYRAERIFYRNYRAVTHAIQGLNSL